MPEIGTGHGIPNRPQTPVGNVLSFNYAQEAEAKQKAKYGYLRDTRKPLALSMARQHTRASMLAAIANATSNWEQAQKETSAAERFKMKKFMGIEGRVETYNRRKK